MIKLWTGIEQEGLGNDSAVKTLFVCANREIDIGIVLDQLKNDNSIKAVYLGAGRTPFNDFFDDGYMQLLHYTIQRNIRIVIEVEPELLRYFYRRFDGPNVLFVCTHYNIPKGMTNLYFKTDDFNFVRIFAIAKKVDITELNNNLYKGDEVVYEKEV